jgi:hypothetical protein
LFIGRPINSTKIIPAVDARAVVAGASLHSRDAADLLRSSRTGSVPWTARAAVARRALGLESINGALDAFEGVTAPVVVDALLVAQGLGNFE